jgi:hypothetical protein
MSQRAPADISLEPVHDSHSGMHSQISLARVDKHREKLTLQQAPSTYTDVRTKTISVPITEVRSNRKDQKLTDYTVLPSHKRSSTNTLPFRFPLTTRHPAPSHSSRLCQARRNSSTQQSDLRTPVLSSQCNLVAQSTKLPSPPKKGQHTRLRCIAFKL